MGHVLPMVLQDDEQDSPFMENMSGLSREEMVRCSTGCGPEFKKGRVCTGATRRWASVLPSGKTMLSRGAASHQRHAGRISSTSARGSRDFLEGIFQDEAHESSYIVPPRDESHRVTHDQQHPQIREENARIAIYHVRLKAINTQIFRAKFASNLRIFSKDD